MSNEKETTGDPILDQRLVLEDKKLKYKQERRILLRYGLIITIDLAIFLIGIIVVGLLGTSTYYGGWVTFITVIFAILFLGLIVYFLMDFIDRGDHYGFGGLGRIKANLSLKHEIETEIEILRILETYLPELRPAAQKRYRDQLPQIIFQYQHQANRYRRIHYTVQIIIIFSSLLVTGLTSGLTGLIGPLGKPWITPAVSFLVSFLTALTTLFRFHDRGYNLQQTADAIDYEVTASDLQIFHYKGLTEEDTLRELAERAERLRDEQRKRQQQLEQSSDTKKSSE